MAAPPHVHLADHAPRGELRRQQIKRLAQTLTIEQRLRHHAAGVVTG
jgi:hypothetical protein